jgi:hypothetical protein
MAWTIPSIYIEWDLKPNMGYLGLYKNTGYLKMATESSMMISHQFFGSLNLDKLICTPPKGSALKPSGLVA